MVLLSIRKPCVVSLALISPWLVGLMLDDVYERQIQTIEDVVELVCFRSARTEELIYARASENETIII